MSALDAALEAGRREAEARMRDQVRLHRVGPAAFDRETGETRPGSSLVLYEGRAWVRPEVTAGRDVQVGERESVLRRYVVSLPWATTFPAEARLLAGDQVHVLESHDARLVGVTLWVVDSQMGEQATAWRITAEDRS
ncbi:DUF6093 family protein [Streptomyces sp. UH6]|uniref:DUF6093 family protein n=1 Tax=Streptomyces sp. UH6 TaxID=2748379 RepID=UPI0015D51F16|nr:DUF6093 family protein [Streptomyces sp. UH6]NYV73185.1 hypothetical protein [Streptomyces sp. UH6]